MARWERSGIASIVHTAVLCGVFVLLLLATLSIPILHWAYLTVEGNGYTVTLGTFGWCRTGGKAGDFCSGRSMGYNVQEAVLLTFPERSGVTVREWFNMASNGLIAIAVTAGIAGLATLTSLLGKTSFALIWSTLLGMITCVLATGCVILNGILFTALKRDVLLGGATSATLGMGYWFVIGACAGSFVVPVLAVIECCAGQIKRWREPKGEYVKIDTPAENTRNSTYRQSAYELPLFDLGQAQQAQANIGELGTRTDAPANPSPVRTSV
ncbi:hypothetical protein CC85DRAFT_288287 [Cutaneotrichosporon oleaginosum]|uniref:Pali-domain-containing protein n=1 Tax=Cutaneotrichosporon oleaginosum TaxID=879819 RepID=A0A0J0XF91_9TREE|nr:uncharacterized protein CC85DRAFT_288287 [Cutaneotrichosporon oleaginosum]KLT39713.1 hypothetical protein CC85DRAFT_288287 [Cutaneotrichosporon oleaginosum]TXT12428.1 hypothetical protein COLE_02838 [Cutaneotrichosporon oleaginosum]